MKAVPAKIAVVGAGIYGSTTALRLGADGHDVQLFDPLGVLRAASSINQYRVHAGYHYPRSAETIAEIAEARAEFTKAFAPAIVGNSRHYYAIPREDSRTPPEVYERVMRTHGLPLRACRPDWMNFAFIERCYEVDENIYDPDVLRAIIKERLKERAIPLQLLKFIPEMREDYDFVVWATYGLGPRKELFRPAKYQVAEKLLVELPPPLQGVALVVVDGPFTAFDPYGSSSRSLFGSAKNTNHWTTTDAREPIPEPYASMLNRREFEPVPFTAFESMRADACLTAPAAKHAKYIGSRFTVRVVEDDPKHDRRILQVREGNPGEIHIFSGKVVSAVKAARLVCKMISGGRGD